MPDLGYDDLEQSRARWRALKGSARELIRHAAIHRDYPRSRDSCPLDDCRRGINAFTQIPETLYVEVDAPFNQPAERLRVATSALYRLKEILMKTSTSMWSKIGQAIIVIDFADDAIENGTRGVLEQATRDMPTL